MFPSIKSVIVMAGGLGSRLGRVKKALIEVCGFRFIDRVVSVGKSLCGNVVVAYTEHVRELREACAELGVECFMTSGRGYSLDLGEVLDSVELPALVLPVDMPLLTEDILRDFISKALSINAPIVCLCVINGDTCKLVGVSLIKEVGAFEVLLPYPPRPELIDVDTPEDLEKVRELCGSMEVSGAG